MTYHLHFACFHTQNNGFSDVQTRQNWKHADYIKKRNWIKKATTITRIYNEQRWRNPQARQLYRFLGLNPADEREETPATLHIDQIENTNDDAG